MNPVPVRRKLQPDDGDLEPGERLWQCCAICDADADGDEPEAYPLAKAYWEPMRITLREVAK